MEILLWRIIKKKLLEKGESKTEKKKLTKDEAIDQLLRDNNYFRLEDGKYYVTKTKTIKAPKTKVISSTDIVFDDGKINVLPTPKSDTEQTNIGLSIELETLLEGEETEATPIQISFLEKEESDQTE